MSRNIARFFHFSLETELNALHFINYTIPRLCSTYAVATIEDFVQFYSLVRVRWAASGSLLKFCFYDFNDYDDDWARFGIPTVGELEQRGIISIITQQLIDFLQP